MSYRLLFVALIAFPLLVLAGCQDDHKTHQATTLNSYELPVVKVAIQQVPRLYTVPGSVQSEERIQISSRITGYIQKIFVHEGDEIKKGKSLVEIDPTEIEATIRRAQAVVKSATTSLRDLKSDVSRLAKLKQKRVVSQENYRKATVKRDVADSMLAEAKAALDSTLAQRRYATIKSPFDGITVGRHKEQGDLTSPGTPILTIESKKRFLFETFVAENRVRHVRIGSTVNIMIDAMGKQAIAGTVLRIIPAGDPVTRRYEVKIALPEQLKAYPGMFGRAHFTIGTDRFPVIPGQALVNRGGLNGVFVLDQDNHARFRWLRTGREWIDKNASVQLEVKAGLAGGETILAHDDRRVHDGDMITVLKKAASDE